MQHTVSQRHEKCWSYEDTRRMSEKVMRSVDHHELHCHLKSSLLFTTERLRVWSRVMIYKADQCMYHMQQKVQHCDDSKNFSCEVFMLKSSCHVISSQTASVTSKVDIMRSLPHSNQLWNAEKKVKWMYSSTTAYIERKNS